VDIVPTTTSTSSRKARKVPILVAGMSEPVEVHRYGLGWWVKAVPPEAVVTAYEGLMEEEAYAVTDDIISGHYFASSAVNPPGRSGASATMTAAWKMRVASEMATMPSLAISWGSSILVRSEETSMDIVRAIITGPRDTAYANGLFMFDIHIPPSYPDTNPSVKIVTTAGGSVRFNPNL